MKRIQFIILFIGINIYATAQKISFDAKYIQVGVMSNEWPQQLSNNPNLRNLGELPLSFENEEKLDAKLITEYLYKENAGKKALDALLQRNESLSMDKLYSQALQNTILEEIEVARQDASAESINVLKKEISRQLLKNNYIVIFQTTRKQQRNRVKTKKYWQVFHIDIDDRIIDQVFLNWNNLTIYDQIEIPITFIAEGKLPKAFENENELLFDIAKKVSAFAIRGSILKRTPFLARTTSIQGVKKGDRFYVYRFTENKSGDIYSKKVCTARATEVNNESTRLYTISGKYASTKKGDIAVQKDRHKSSFSIMGQYSAGNDPRIGGRLQFEQLLKFSKKGIAQYFLSAIDYNSYKKEPNNIWWDYDNNKNIQPKLHNIEAMLGYGIGFNFLGRLELMPYLLAGYQFSFFSSCGDNPVYWNQDLEIWDSLKDSEMAIVAGHSIIGYAGMRMNINIWYPIQLTIGADYNIAFSLTDSLKPVLSRHELNRLNIFAGLRFHF